MSAATFHKLIYNVGKVLSQNIMPFNERLQNVVGFIARHFEVEKCSVMLINREDMTLEVVAATHTAIIGMKRNLSDVTIATRALLEDAPFQANKKRLSYFVPKDATRYSSCNSVSIPIKYQDQKIGVINLTDTKNYKPLTRAQIKEACEIAHRLAVHLYAAYAKYLLEKEIKKYENAITKLKEADGMKTNLTSFIVHDLKGPVSTIMANLDMLTYEQLNTQQLELVTLALTDVYKMQRMVMNILDVMKMEQREINIYREEIDLCELVQREIVSLKSLLAMRGISIVFDGESRRLFIDETLLGRTISNILINAVDHSPDGKQITVNVRYDADRKEASVSVADEGTGIPDEFKEKVFDKFFQIEAGKIYRKTTTGLGLTFCKFVIEAHGGLLWIEDNEGGGTRFIFTIPETVRGVTG